MCMKEVRKLHNLKHHPDRSFKICELVVFHFQHVIILFTGRLDFIASQRLLNVLFNN